MENGSAPLEDRKLERFAQHVANGDSAAEAYRKVNKKASPASAETHGPEWLRRRQVSVRVDWYRKAVQDKAMQEAENAVLTMAEKRMFLARAVRTAIGEVGPDSPLCQEYTRTQKMVGRGDEAVPWDVEKIKSVGKLEAIKIDNDMAGELPVPKIEVVIRKVWEE